MTLTLITGETVESDVIRTTGDLLCIETSSGDCVPLGRFKLDRELMKLIKDNYEQIYTQG
jgi:hypothetical protein